MNASSARPYTSYMQAYWAQFGGCYGKGGVSGSPPNSKQATPKIRLLLLENRQAYPK